MSALFQNEKDCLEWLAPLEDPELRLPLVSLGLIYSCALQEKSVETGKRHVDVTMTLTSPACPAAGFMVEQVKKRLEEHPEISDAKVELVFTPKWDPKTMASEEAKEKLGIW